MDKISIGHSLRYIAMSTDTRGQLRKLPFGAISDEDDKGLSETVCVANHLDEQTAIESRHVDIHENNVGTRFANRVQAAERAVMKSSGKTGVLKTAHGATAKDGIVVDDEHSVHAQPVITRRFIQDEYACGSSVGWFDRRAVRRVDRCRSLGFLCKAWTNAAGIWKLRKIVH